jgi:hypothetical protein
MEALFESSTL